MGSTIRSGRTKAINPITIIKAIQKHGTVIEN